MSGVSSQRLRVCFSHQETECKSVRQIGLHRRTWLVLSRPKEAKTIKRGQASMRGKWARATFFHAQTLRLLWEVDPVKKVKGMTPTGGTLSEYTLLHPLQYRATGNLTVCECGYLVAASDRSSQALLPSPNSYQEKCTQTSALN